MMINSDDNDDDNSNISARVKLDHDDLLIPSSIFSPHILEFPEFQKNCFVGKFH